MHTVVRGGEGKSEVATGTFTGEAWRDILMAPTDGIAVGNVFFTPCSRTYWHSHEGGQLLENGAVTVRAGDMVWTPPDVRHWHGASQGRYLLHTAITVGGTNWEQPVSDDEYQRA